MIMESKEYKELELIVNSHFNDMEKTNLWIISSNPLLGNISPLQMIVLGRYEKLLKVIKMQIDENSRDL